MPNKTIYVSDDDLELFQRAQELSGGNLSAAISMAIRRYVEFEEGRSEGYEEIVVRVGTKAGRKQRFLGVLLGEWSRAKQSGSVETFRVYRSRSGKYVVHKSASKGWQSGSPDDKWNKGWRSWVGNWSGDQGWGVIPAHSTLHIADTLDELREFLPKELFDMVVQLAEQPDIEDLDI